jgi:mono/diheme cytochrome c family protein
MPRKLLLWIFSFFICAGLHAQTISGGPQVESAPSSGGAKAQHAPSSSRPNAEHAPPPAGLGRLASAEELKQRDITTLPDGAGLPDGKGTAAQGEAVYRDKCASCHGANGEGKPEGPQLVGGVGSLANDNPIKTVGSFWPYATTVWDYIHRAMPLNQPGGLSADDTYSITAFLLNRNKIIEANEIISKETLPKVRMPNRDGFVPDARPDVGKNASSSTGVNKHQKSQAR